MCVRYGCLLEEICGLSRCVIILYSFLYFYKDIQCFGFMDNYFCWIEERVVYSYIKKLNNYKNIEVIFVYSEVYWEFIKFRDIDNFM